MLTATVLSAGSVSSKYYHEEGYYKDREEAGEASQWHGKGALEAGLTGKVDDDVFQALLAGKAPDGTDLVQKTDSGQTRRMGHDLTFSAPKDVSILALVGQDDQVVAAHDAAVKTALDHLETNGIKVRVYNTQTKSYDRVDGQSAFFALFRHKTSRELDPQLHTHGIVVNMAVGEDGKTRAITSEEFYNQRKMLDTIYKAELATGLRDLGYDVRREGAYGDIKVSGLPASVGEGFSKRAGQIKEMMVDSQDQNVSAAAERAALATRASKSKTVDWPELQATWNAELKDYGFGREELDQLKARAHDLDIKPALKAERTQEYTPDSKSNPASKAVGKAIAHFSERDAVYSKDAVIMHALNRTVGLNPDAVQSELDTRLKDGRLFDAKNDDFKDGITDSKTLGRERSMIGEMQNGWDASSTTFTTLSRWTQNAERAVTRSLHGSTLTPGQRDAVSLIMSSTDRIVGVQGHAGTGKTYMLERAQSLANRQGFEVEAIGPSTKSVEALRDSKIKSATVASFLIGASTQGLGNKSNTVLVVDEASMVDTKDMLEVLRTANRAGYNRVVLMGDVSQLASIGAGAAFAQLQNAGMKMAYMSEINRQKDETLLAGVYATINKDVQKAFNLIGDRIHGDASGEYVKNTADAYLALSPQERVRTGIIAQSNKARTDMNGIIRTELINEGQVAAHGVTKDHYSPRNLTNAEMREVGSYTVGDHLIAMADIKSARISEGDSFVVLGPDSRSGRLRVRLDNNAERLIDVSNKTTADRLSVFNLESREYAAGDAIRFRSNDKGLGIINGEQGVVKEATKDGLTITKTDGTEVAVSDNTTALKVMDYAYSATVHAFQGDTVDRILVAMGAKEALTNTASFYVGISRAKHEAELFTDDPAKLAKTLEDKTGVSTPGLSAVAATRSEQFTPIEPHVNSKTEIDATSKDITEINSKYEPESGRESNLETDLEQPGKPKLETDLNQRALDAHNLKEETPDMDARNTPLNDTHRKIPEHTNKDRSDPKTKAPEGAPSDDVLARELRHDATLADDDRSTDKDLEHTKAKEEVEIEL